MSRIVHITRRERFSAAHKLWNAEWDEAENEKVFGKCSNPNWHGHNYELWVTVKGPISSDTGFVIDLSDLGKILREKVISKLDHKNVNLDVDFMKDQMSSTENIAVGIWDQIKPAIESLGGELVKLKLQETENNFVEYYGD